MTTTTSVLSLRLKEKLLDGLNALAESTKRSKTFLVEEAIIEYLEANSWQVDEITRAVAEADAGDFASEEEIESLNNKYKS